MPILFFAVSLLASTIGAICGIGGGVIIKPALDFLQVASVATISFLSGCTVLSMASYSVGKMLTNPDIRIDMRICTPLAIGAAIGGALGNSAFSQLKSLLGGSDAIGAVQAGCLGIITVATLAYTINRRRIQTLELQSLPAIVLIGLALGLMSSFLGIGGGPINLVALYYFFSMTTKNAAQSSLYIILFSQLSSLAITLALGRVPAFEPLALVLMVAGGILGGIAGRALFVRIDERIVGRLFIGLMVAIIGISAYNVYQYTIPR